MYILNDFLQITAPTSIILYIIEIRKKSSIEWCKELTPSDRSFRIADWRYLYGTDLRGNNGDVEPNEIPTRESLNQI